MSSKSQKSSNPLDLFLNSVSKCLDTARCAVLYYIIWTYIQVRWFVYSATGLWSFENESKLENRTCIEKDKLGAACAQKTAPKTRSNGHKNKKCPLVNYLRRLKNAELYLICLPFVPAPGNVRYLGQFTYESWNDRRWKPREGDYDADDEAGDEEERA